MARHGPHRRATQLSDGRTPSLAPIGADAATVSLNPDVSLTTASSNPVLTIITSSVEIVPAPTGSEVLAPTTVATTISITDSAVFSSLTASKPSTAASESSRTSSSATSAAATSSATTSAKSSSSNLSTLIPAIVVPIAVILLASLGIFWFFMRRRHRRELQNTEFVMAGKGEKLSSRSNSSRCGSRGGNAAEKSLPVISVSEVRPPQPGPKYSLEDIGVARPLAPKDSDTPSSRPRSPNRQHGPGHRDRNQYQNFNGPRPSTSRQPPPSRSGEPQSRNRSNSSPAKRGPLTGYGYDPYRPGGPTQRAGPSPVIRSGLTLTIGGLPKGLPINPRSAATSAGPGVNRLRDPSPTVRSSMTMNNRAQPPPALAPPPPGAYNGASPISQYSPIVKETPSLASAATFALPNAKTSNNKNSPPPLQTRNLTDTARSQSPASPSGFLTEENLRIARLANNSRLGFFNTSATSPSADNSFSKATHLQSAQVVASPTTASNPSPKLPPPATRSQLIPADSPRDERKVNYFGNASKHDSRTSSHYPQAAPPSRRHTKKASKDDDADSTVSDLDAYEDIDAKSDVSSLDHFERFDLESRNESRMGSARGSRSIRAGVGLGVGPFGR